MRVVARAYSTPLPTVLEMDWLEIVGHAYAAYHHDYLKKMFRLKLVGARVKI